MEKKQTAVKWLWQWIMKNPLGSFGDGVKAYNKAKQMEKEQIKDAFVECWKSNIPEGIECKLSAEEYYYKTYGNAN